jgi:hypothetical protein
MHCHAKGLLAAMVSATVQAFIISATLIKWVGTVQTTDQQQRCAVVQYNNHLNKY